MQVSKGDGPSWKSGPPDGLPELNKLSVECGKEEMTIHLEFTAPYDGTIYSKSNGQSPRCIHIAPYSHITEVTFSVNYHSCGTRSDSQGKFYENTIIIQYDDTVIEAWDEAKKIRCEWHDGYEKSAFKMPITISDLDVVEMNFQGDDVDCWLEVQDGKGPWSAKVEGLVPLGSPLTLVVAVQDSEGQFDMRVKSCIAHDGYKNPIHLTDEDGCVLRPKMMSPFQKTTDTKGAASVIAYSHFYAFKFPETVEVTIQCTVEICRHGCPNSCLQGREAQTSKPLDEYLLPQAKEQDDVPTYKDTHAFSTVITSKPGSQSSLLYVNASTNATTNTASNETKNDDVEPLKSSSDVHGIYVDRYPYNLFDVLEMEERQDSNKHDMYADLEEDGFTDRKDDLYFPQPPEAYTSEIEYGKHFSTNQKIENVSQDVESITQNSHIAITPYKSKNVTEEENEETETPIYIMETEEKFPDLRDEAAHSVIASRNAEIVSVPLQNQILDDGTQSYEENPEYEDANSNDRTQSYDETPAHEDPTLSDESQTPIETRQSHTLHELFSSELFKDTSYPAATADKSEKFTDDSNPETITKESSQKSNTHKSNSTQEFDSYNDENNEHLTFDNYEYPEKRMIDDDADTRSKKLQSKKFENIKARTPIDDNEMRHNLHNFNYKPFMPLAPQPPLTLYNGVPLYYYNSPNAYESFFKRDGLQYMDRQPYHKEYIKSKLRKPGRRRGRREIGEKEQLGLKQTLRVIATTDLDFLVKDEKTIEPLYVGKPDVQNDVCIAPSTFAAGLGLLLLANICVLCVVIFLGHHYYINRNMRAKNKDLLCTEMNEK